jgi:hypothetical protein
MTSNAVTHDQEHLELVFLYALQALSPREIPGVEEQISNCPDCRQQLEDVMRIDAGILKLDTRPISLSDVVRLRAGQTTIYEGPLFIDFRLPVEWSVQDDHRGTPVTPQQVVIGNVSPIAAGNIVEGMQRCLAESDDGYETGAEVLRLAFPKLHAAIEGSHEGGESPDREEALPEAELRKALHAELERFFTGSWRRAQLGKKTDAISKLAHQMDLPIKLARKYEEMARE